MSYQDGFPNRVYHRAEVYIFDVYLLAIKSPKPQERHRPTKVCDVLKANPALKEVRL